MTRTQHTYRKTVSACALALLSVGSLSGCVLGNDSDPPVLSVDLYWESDRRSDSTCSSADVTRMDWQLTHGDGEVIVENEDTDKGHACNNGFDFPDVGPGDYVLKVTGYDSDDNPSPVWSGECELWLDRFDRYFQCDIPKATAD